MSYDSHSFDAVQDAETFLELRVFHDLHTINYIDLARAKYRPEFYSSSGVFTDKVPSDSDDRRLEELEKNITELAGHLGVMKDALKRKLSDMQPREQLAWWETCNETLSWMEPLRDFAPHYDSDGEVEGIYFLAEEKPDDWGWRMAYWGDEGGSPNSCTATKRACTL